ncbi:TonB-dependent receptor [Cupriavidus sp. H39]|uniref:TonB-dependent receptor n=1 Tax=Cupriavidus sp. H39 TaxID=3401635 RepID=UPI003D01238C
MADARRRTCPSLPAPGMVAVTLAAATPVAAQQASPDPGIQADQVHNLQEVTVVAPTPLPGFTIERQAFPANVQTATDGDLERAKSTNLPSFLAEHMNGIVVNDAQGNPFAQDILYRGYRLSPTLGSTQGLSLYLDGVRQNAALGDIINWAGIPEAALSTVTLVPGSNPLYGLNTLGGALALVTKSGETHPGVEADLSIGSYGRARLDVSAGKSLGDGWHAYFAGTGWREDGWRDRSGSDLGNLFFKLGRSTSATQWSMSLLGSNSRLSGNGLTPDSIYGSDRRAIYTAPDVTRVKSLQLTLNGAHQFNAQNQLQLTAYVRRTRLHANSGDINDDYLDTLLGCQGAEGCQGDEVPPSAILNTSTVSETSYGLSAQWSLDGETHRFALGAALDLNRSRYTQATQLASFDAARTAQGDPNAPVVTNALLDGHDSTVGLYATDTIRLLPHSFLTLAARWNDGRRHTVLGAPTPSDERFTFSRLNPSVGVSHLLSDSVTVFGSASQGTRMPTAIELGCADPANACQLPTGLQADPFLRQVVTRTVELGGRWQPADTTEMTLALYRSHNTDDIIFQRSPFSPLGYFSNFPKTRNQGLELGLRQRLGRLTLRAGYSYTQATYRADGQLQTPFAAPVMVHPGTRMAGIPLHSFRLGADWRATTSVSVGGDVIVSSSRPVAGNEDGALSAQDPGLARTAGFLLLNLRASWQFSPRWQVYGRIDNLFDRRYQTYGQVGYNLFPDGTLLLPGAAVPVGRFVAPGAARLFLVGVRYEWDGR